MDFLSKFFGSLSAKDSAVAPYYHALSKQDWETAIPILKSAMDNDDEVAMGLFGAMTAMGYGVLKNHGEASLWFRQAANRNHVLSQSALGLCLATGQGVTQDTEEAAYWLWQAGKAGNVQAIHALGELCLQDAALIGVHFSEDELCDLVLDLRRLVPKAERTARPQEEAL